MEYKINKKTLITIAVILFATVLFAWSLNNASVVSAIVSGFIKITLPLILGFCIAFVINLPMRFFERKVLKNAKKPIAKTIRRTICILISIIIVLAIVSAVMILVVPQFINAIMLIGQTVASELPALVVWITENVQLNSELEAFIASFELDWAKMGADVLSYVTDSAGMLVGSAFTMAMAIVGGITNFVLAFIFAIYILLGKETLKAQLGMLLNGTLPDKACKAIFYFGKMTNEVFANFIIGQVTEAFILGGLAFLGMSLFGFPYASAISALLGILALIPIVGAYVAAFTGAFLIFTQNPLQALYFLIFCVVLQQLEGNIIYPRVVGGSVGLPGIWVLASITVFGSLGGIVGMLVAVPICSVLYTLVKLIAQMGLQKKQAAKALHQKEHDSKSFIKEAIISVVVDGEETGEKTSEEKAEATNGETSEK